MEWLVKLRKICPRLEFFGQDAKAKIPVGDDVPVWTDVEAHNTGIVPAGDKCLLQALDHDFHVGNITQSVTLPWNIPKDFPGSIFICDDRD